MLKGRAVRLLHSRCGGQEQQEWSPESDPDHPLHSSSTAFFIYSTMLFSLYYNNGDSQWLGRTRDDDPVQLFDEHGVVESNPARFTISQLVYGTLLGG
jgi:hypothetical protein